MININELGKRIAIIGCSNAGKSTLGTLLGKKLIVPVYHLDTFAHEPGTNWQRLSNDHLFLKHNNIIDKEAWVIDGNYSFCMKERFCQATSIIWLDPKVHCAMYYYLKRSLQNNPNRPGRLEGAKREFNLTLVKWILQYPKRRLKYEKMLPNGKTIVRIHSMSELNKYYIHWGLIEHL